MAISTKGTYLNITGTGLSDGIRVDIKSFPDLGAAPAAIDVTTLADEVQKFIPGVKGMAAMEFVANYDDAKFTELSSHEGEDLTYTMNFGDGTKYKFDGQHNALIVGGALNAALDMKIVVTPSSAVTKVSA